MLYFRESEGEGFCPGATCETEDAVDAFPLGGGRGDGCGSRDRSGSRRTWSAPALFHLADFYLTPASWLCPRVRGLWRGVQYSLQVYAAGTVVQSDNGAWC